MGELGESGAAPLLQRDLTQEGSHLGSNRGELVVGPDGVALLLGGSGGHRGFIECPLCGGELGGDTLEPGLGGAVEAVGDLEGVQVGIDVGDATAHRPDLEQGAEALLLLAAAFDRRPLRVGLLGQAVDVATTASEVGCGCLGLIQLAGHVARLLGQLADLALAHSGRASD